jgi:hypothetical protein
MGWRRQATESITITPSCVRGGRGAAYELRCPGEIEAGGGSSGPATHALRGACCTVLSNSQYILASLRLGQAPRCHTEFERVQARTVGRGMACARLRRVVCTHRRYHTITYTISGCTRLHNSLICACSLPCALLGS